MEATLQGPSVQSRALLSAKVDEPPGRKCRNFKMQTAQFAMAYNQSKLCNKSLKCIAKDRRMRYKYEGGTPRSLKEGICSAFTEFFQNWEVAALLGSPAHLSPAHLRGHWHFRISGVCSRRAQAVELPALPCGSSTAQGADPGRGRVWRPGTQPGAASPSPLVYATGHTGWGGGASKCPPH